MYNVYSLTFEQLCDLIRSGDDTHHNQIRIRKNGDIFLSQDVGASNLGGIAGRFETFDAYNGYVGPEAAADMKWMNRVFNAIQEWKKDPVSYIDVY